MRICKHYVAAWEDVDDGKASPARHEPLLAVNRAGILVGQTRIYTYIPCAIANARANRVVAYILCAGRKHHSLFIDCNMLKGSCDTVAQGCNCTGRLCFWSALEGVLKSLDIYLFISSLFYKGKNSSVDSATQHAMLRKIGRKWVALLLADVMRVFQSLFECPPVSKISSFLRNLRCLLLFVADMISSFMVFICNSLRISTLVTSHGTLHVNQSIIFCILRSIKMLELL